MAPHDYLEGKGKLFSVLAFFAVLMWPIFDYICNYFDLEECKEMEPTNDGSPLFDVSDYVKVEDYPLSNFRQTHLLVDDLKSEIQRIGKDLQDKFAILAKEVLGKQMQLGLSHDIANKNGHIPRIPYEFKKPAKEHGVDFDKEREEVKKAVENVSIDRENKLCVNDGKFKILLESKLNIPDSDDTRGPKLSQCSGGNGNNSPPNNQVTTKESKIQKSSLATAYPSGGCGNDGGGLGGDGDDDPDKRDPVTKGHYQEIPEPQKIKDEDELPDGNCIVQPGLLLTPVPCPKSAESTSHGDGSTNIQPGPLQSSRSVGSTSYGNESAAMPLDPLSFSESSELTSHGNGSAAMAPGPFAYSERFETTSRITGSPARQEDLLPSLENTESTSNGNGLSTRQLETLGNDMSVSTNEHRAALENKREDYGNTVSDVGQRYPDNIPSFEHIDENHETSLQEPPPYKMLYSFQPELPVRSGDGRYLVNRDFIIIREIARGRYGVCYKILDRRSRKVFALKKIKVKHFEPNEIEIWSRFSPSHPNVVTLLGAYDDGQHVHIFMELMTDTLKFLADNRSQLDLTERKIAAVIKPVLKFLEQLHKQGYVHVDMKSENTFFGLNDIKVGDFGLALRRSGESSLRIGPRGTVPFMPKELFRGGEYCAAVDIYYVAGVVIHLLGGALPWASYEKETIILLVGRGEMPAIPITCSEEMKKLLKWMLDPDHAKRPTALKLLQDPVFADVPESILDDVLQELLVDIAILRRPVDPVQVQVLDASNNLEAAPMTLDGDDGDKG